MTDPMTRPGVTVTLVAANVRAHEPHLAEHGAQRYGARATAVLSTSPPLAAARPWMKRFTMSAPSAKQLVLERP
jgi:hypothetical protein